MAKITVEESVLLEGIEQELKDRFRWTSVEGLVELEASAIARYVLRRLPGNPTQPPQTGGLVDGPPGLPGDQP